MAGQILNTEVFGRSWEGDAEMVGMAHPDIAQNYRDGSYWPFIRDESDLEWSRGIAHFISTCDSSGICALENLTSYTIGNGFSWDVVSKEKADAPTSLIDQCVEVLEEFQERTDWWGREIGFNYSAHQLGEGLLAIESIGGGMAKSRLYLPAHLTEPVDRNWASDYLGLADASWSFGVATDYDDTEAVHGYCFDVRGDGTDYRVYEARDVQHLKLNVNHAVKRGLSDFYCCHENMRQRAKLLGNVAEGTALQAAIAWVEENALGVTQTAVEGTVGERMDRGIIGRAQQAAYNAGMATTSRARRIDKGTVLNVGSGKKYQPGPLGASSSGKESAMLVGDAVGRFIGSRWQMPEFMFNNNADTANYASTFVAESPFVKSTMRRQAVVSGKLRKAVWRVLEIAIQGGRITGVTSLEDLKRLVEVKASPPTIESRDRKSETDRNKILVAEGIMAPRTWAAREDLDYDEEIEAGAEHVRERFPQPEPSPLMIANGGGNKPPKRPTPSDKRESVYP